MGCGTYLIMSRKILIISGSPKKDGNTAQLIRWFSEGAREHGASVEVVEAAFLKHKASGCISCRQCQTRTAYECVLDDDVTPVLKRMQKADVIVMATPLYFFAASAQLKIVMDRMFSLYKWDNAAGTMQTPLQGKRFVLIASAFERTGLKALEQPFRLTAEYTGMTFSSLLIPDAGVSGEIKGNAKVQRKVQAFGAAVTGS